MTHALPRFALAALLALAPAACGPAASEPPVWGGTSHPAQPREGTLAPNRNPGHRPPGGVPPQAVDRDGDGVADTVDRCPDEPEDRDGFEDADGCPDPDNDMDGIPDVQDQCPNDHETLNGFEDEDGCPEGP